LQVTDNKQFKNTLFCSITKMRLIKYVTGALAKK